MRDRNIPFLEIFKSDGVRLYLTYEGSKLRSYINVFGVTILVCILPMRDQNLHEFSQYAWINTARLYLTYEGSKPRFWSREIDNVPGLYLTYEGSKLVAGNVTRNRHDSFVSYL